MTEITRLGLAILLLEIPKLEIKLKHFMEKIEAVIIDDMLDARQVLCLLYTSPSPRDQRGSRMPSSA